MGVVDPSEGRELPDRPGLPDAHYSGGLNTRTGEPRRWVQRIGPAYVITPECIACGACVRACPFDAIEQEGFRLWVVAEECPGCARCVPVCPVDTIRPDPTWKGELVRERAPVVNPWRT